MKKRMNGDARLWKAFTILFFLRLLLGGAAFAADDAGKTAGSAAGGPGAESEPQRVLKEMMRILRRSRFRGGYKISGRVIDQDGRPVAGAAVKVHSKWARTGFDFFQYGPRVLEYKTITDENGRFRVKVRGIEPWIVDIQKLGYVWEKGRDQGLYPADVVYPDHTTLPMNPHLVWGDAVFHMWKKGPRAILLKPGLYLGFHSDDRTRDFIKPVRLLPFFAPEQRRGRTFHSFPSKMRKRLKAANPFKSAEDRKLLISLGYDLGVRAHPDLEAKKWRVTLWMFRPDDGMLFTTNQRQAVAPETGYKRRLEFSVPFKYQDEKGRYLPERLIRGRLFFRFFKPVLYSTCCIEIESRDTSVIVRAERYAVNPYGGRNLERDWGVPGMKVMYPLRKEFCAAILAADAGKPVKLPDEAKYKKMLEDILAKDKEARKWYIRYNTDVSCQRWP